MGIDAGILERNRLMQIEQLRLRDEQQRFQARLHEQQIQNHAVFMAHQRFNYQLPPEAQRAQAQMLVRQQAVLRQEQHQAAMRNEQERQRMAAVMMREGERMAAAAHGAAGRRQAGERRRR